MARRGASEMRSSRAANAILEPARKRQQQQEQQQHPVLHAGIVLGKEIAAVEAGWVRGEWLGGGKGRQMQSTNNEMNCQVQTCR